MMLSNWHSMIHMIQGWQFSTLKLQPNHFRLNQTGIWSRFDSSMCLTKIQAQSYVSQSKHKNLDVQNFFPKYLTIVPLAHQYLSVWRTTSKPHQNPKSNVPCIHIVVSYLCDSVSCSLLMVGELSGLSSSGISSGVDSDMFRALTLTDGP